MGQFMAIALILHPALVFYQQQSSVFVMAQEHLLLRGGNKERRARTRVKQQHDDNNNNTHSSTIPPAKTRLPLVARAGTHHLQVFVGQPPMKQILIVDTGSRLTAWTCHPCRDCGQHASETYYNPQRSTTSSVRVPETTIQQHSCRRNRKDASSCHFTGFSKCSDDTDDRSNRCWLEQRYTEGSTWSAYEVTDLVTLGVAPSVSISQGDNKNNKSSSNVDISYLDSVPYTIPFTFGCQTSLSGLFREQHGDGILGLEHSDFIITSALVEHGAFDDDPDIDPDINDSSSSSSNTNQRNLEAFSLCLSTAGGWVGLGGGALLDRHWDRMGTTPLVMTDPSAKKSMYAVTVQEVWLGGTCLAGPESEFVDDSASILQAFADAKGTILDSGTTDTYLPAKLSRVFKEAWLNQTGRQLGIRTDNYTREEFRNLPDVRLVFTGNVSLTVPPMNFMEGASAALWRMDDQQQVELTNRMYVDEDRGAVLGINSMLDHDIFFDWKGGVIGIAPADCT